MFIELLVSPYLIHVCPQIMKLPLALAKRYSQCTRLAHPPRYSINLDSLHALGTLKDFGSLFHNNTFVSRDSLLTFRTLRNNGSLSDLGTLPSVGSLLCLGTLRPCGSLHPCDTLVNHGSLHHLGTLHDYGFLPPAQGNSLLLSTIIPCLCRVSTICSPIILGGTCLGVGPNPLVHGFGSHFKSGNGTRYRLLPCLARSVITYL